MIYCTSHKKRGQTAGAKAPADISTIAEQLGLVEIPFEMAKHYNNINLTRIMSVGTGLRNWHRLLRTVEDGDCVIIQHPNENILVANKLIDICKQKKDCKFVALIHDMESIRQNFVDNSSMHSRNALADEELLKKCDLLICHNDAMKAYLIDHGFLSEKIVVLGIFDYLHNCVLPEQRFKEKRVVVAGNVMKEKCEYLYKLMKINNLPFALEIFGPGFSFDNTSDFIHYHGVCKPDELPEKLDGSFGLVWDGTELDCCAGNAGEYIRYNNPHKCSLFLASNMPVIIWEEAALAKFVKDNNVGITINSLMDIGRAIESISDDEYRCMVNNTKTIGEKLRAGYYFSTAIKEVEKRLG